ncbi:PE-PPE domain-containing protein [Mycolicibacterium sp. P1-18]|uniref:PE-PPE domain-containing protein n=1 Tax=Mycolicibacterium sp. P1-18 TaxID=2024615 RepID=UPI0011F2B32D|nr:PE-PPE domain-containing protein [Mycolicibacterium sp. P1-18]KAA0097945.1 PE-PPE domain-containing protein [Mycolicibacterium sp. P1-18]
MFEFVVRPGTISATGGRGRMGRRSLAAALLAAAVAVTAPGALASAQTRIGLNGGRPTEWPILSNVLASQGLTQEGWLDFASRVGENWLPGTDSVPLNYPGQLGIVSGPNALTADQSTALGQQLLHALILDQLKKGEPVAVAGLSEGTLVIDRELAYLQSLKEEDAPSRDALTFYVFGDMLRGLGQMYLPGVTIPFIGQTFGPVPETRYDTVVVNEEWDGWANPPDRPWNPLAVLNAVMGAVYTVNGSNDHSQTSLDSVDDAVLVSQVKSSLGGTTSTYIVPRTQLPITRPLLQLGVPRWVVDEIDKMLMPLIRAGYSYMTPELGPRIDRGQLTFTPPTPPELPATTTQLDASSEQPALAASTTDSQPTASEGRHRARVTSAEADEADEAHATTPSTPNAEEGNGTPEATGPDATPVADTPKSAAGSTVTDDEPSTAAEEPTKVVKGSVPDDAKDDPTPRTPSRTKPVRVHESTDSDAPSVKPTGTADTSAGSDAKGSDAKGSDDKGSNDKAAA